MKEMIAFDIGLGTQDILKPEVDGGFNKFVLPSPIKLLKKRVEAIKGDLFIDGYTMGGGPLSKSIVDHAERNSVYMTERSARTISDDLDKVEDKGIILKESKDSEVSKDKNCRDIRSLSLGDLYSLPDVKELLSSIEVDFPSRVGVAVQDHGVSPKGVSDRKFRFDYFKEAIESNRGFSDLIFEEKTGRFSRIDSVIEFLKENGYDPLVMDSKLASVLGCIEEDKRVIVDSGNGHFMAASVDGEEIVGLFEHHTRMLSRDKIKMYLNKLIDGELTNEEVFEDGGHGAYVKDSLDPSEIVVTGPNRNLVPREIGYRTARPLGDVMMTGAFGLCRASEVIPT
ncbi:MAG: Actin superfamily ATPase [Candidatus Methanohalarchaeum thermophilum]|uniref:Actin superfamily ATPase n=1 Tax=Methanohalarchaeum thermophilum TaxID=1903181 RepID=A0A1Q6DWH7_METT1|nr:MAG: Actin superfamily ATPase [Candidatus Methanohalarchaeum thermophilum]